MGVICDPGNRSCGIAIWLNRQIDVQGGRGDRQCDVARHRCGDSLYSRILWGCSLQGIGPLKEIEWITSVPVADRGPLKTARALRGQAVRTRGPQDPSWPAGLGLLVKVSVSGGAEDTGYRVVYRKIERSNLVLAVPGGGLPIAWSNAAPDDAGPASDSKSSEYGRPFAIDIGDAPSVTCDKVPPGICQAGEKDTQLHVDQGIRRRSSGVSGAGPSIAVMPSSSVSFPYRTSNPISAIGSGPPSTHSSSRCISRSAFFFIDRGALEMDREIVTEGFVRHKR